MGGDELRTNKESNKVKNPMAAALIIQVEVKYFKKFVQKHTSASKDDNDNDKCEKEKSRRTSTK